MEFFSNLKRRYNALIKESAVPLMQSRIKILAFGLGLLMLLIATILILLISSGKTAIMIRLIFLLLTLLYASYLLLYKAKWRNAAHILLIALSLFILTNILMYKHGINLVTFQLSIIIISASFYILGKNWGIMYSAINIMPIIITFTMTRAQGGSIYLSDAEVSSNTFMLCLVFNFILLVLMQYEFFKSFYQSQIKERELNHQLQSALKEAQEATRMRADFLSSMSHELRTPLHAVIGMTNVLSIENPRKDQEENLAILRFSSENLLALINDTLDFSKMNADKIVLNKADFNLTLLVQNINATFHTKAEQKGIILKLTNDFEDQPLFVKGDQTRLTQILNNLVSNAVKFTDTGGLVEMSISTTARTAEKITLLFTVKDDGIGIPANKHDTVFEPFLQANNNITKRYGGTGLGLSIVKRLIELHGSKLKLDSKENVGSTFSFDISYELAAIQEIMPVAVSAASTADISGLNILIAEDNIVNIMVLKKILEQWDCDYSIAKNGLEALEMVKAGSFDIVLMDIHMPVMDGFEAARHIREIPDIRLSKIKIIALTASSDVDIQQSFSYAYLDDYLTKPFRPDLLKKKLEECLPGRA